MWLVNWGLKARLFTQFAERAGWSFADQAVVSLGSFLTSVALARSLSELDFGVYSTLMAVLLFLHGIHNALVISPLTFFGAGLSHTNRARHTAVSTIFTTALLLPAGAICGTVARALVPGNLWILGPAALAAWQLQEVMRRSLMSDLRHRTALGGDAFSYLGQAALIWFGAWQGWITLELAFLVMAATSSAAASLQALQAGLGTVRNTNIQQLVKDYWRFGRWILYASIASAFSFQAFFFILTAFRGPESAAALQAIINILGFSHPLLFGLGNVLAPAVATSKAQGGNELAWRTVRLYGSQFGGLLIGYFTLLILFPRFFLSALYGSDSPYAGLEWPLRLAAAAYSCVFLAHLNASFLTNTGDSRSAFKIQAVTALAGLFVGLPMAVAAGVSGACGGLFTTNLVKLAVSYVMRRRRMRENALRMPAAASEARRCMPAGLK